MYQLIPTREIYWNISGIVWMYVLAMVAFIIFAMKFYQRYRLWKLGQPTPPLDRIAFRLKLVLQYALGQARVLKKEIPD